MSKWHREQTLSRTCVECPLFPFEKNEAKLTTQAGSEAFIAKIVDIARNPTSLSDYDGPEVVLSMADVEAIHKAVEVLSLLNQDPL